MEQKTPEQIIAETKELGDKLKLVEEKIVSKQDKSEELKKSNAKLLGLHIGKQRMPPSVGIQREQIKTIDIELEELKYLKEDLTKQIQEKQKDLEMSNLAQRVIGFKQSNQDYFQIFNKVEQALTNFNLQVGELLGQMREGVHPLSRLRDLCIDLNNNKIGTDVFGIDLMKLVGKYVTTIDKLKELDELKIASEEIQHQVFSYSNQVTGVLKSKGRSFPSKSVPKRTTPPLTEHERRISFFQQACKADDIKTGKGGFQPKILEPVKFIQDKAVAPPGAKVPDHAPPDFAQDPYEEPEEKFPDKELQKEISDEIIEKEIKKVNQ